MDNLQGLKLDYLAAMRDKAAMRRRIAKRERNAAGLAYWHGEYVRYSKEYRAHERTCNAARPVARNRKAI